MIRARCRALVRSASARVHRHGSDRGDVPGWVLITIMTVGLVTALWAVADRELSAMFENALSAFGKG
jgi:hypothetical protein